MAQRDLAAWLGLNIGARARVEDLKSKVLTELSRDSTKKILLFLDNLETVDDTNLFNFLDNDLPQNCWLAATARVHKVRSFVHPIELREMDPHSAARLLRHELKRQGMIDLASKNIGELEAKAKILFLHPLAIRWFAWACKKLKSQWEEDIQINDMREIENFCVAHTLGNMDIDTQKILGAILAISDVAAPTVNCIQRTSGLPESSVDAGLWELECAGLVLANTDEDGVTTYSIAPMAEQPTSELMRKRGWEGEYVQNLRSFTRQQADFPPESPLIRDLLKTEPRQVHGYSREEKNELDARIVRALPKTSPQYSVKLKWLRAECQRHLDNIVTADDIYRECAEKVLPNHQTMVTSIDRVRLLLEAATVAKMRAQTEPQIKRAVQYLETIAESDIARSRILGTLTEMYAMLGDEQKYKCFLKKVQAYKNDHSDELFIQLDDAILRAQSYMERHNSRSRGH